MASETVKKLSVKFEGDTTKLNTAIKLATDSFNDINKATQSLEKQFDKFGSGVSFSKQQQAFDLLNAKVEAGEKAANDLYDMMEQLKKQDTANVLTSQFQKLSEKYNEIVSQTNEAKKQLESLNNIDFLKASTAFEKIKVAIEAANKKINETTTYINAVNKALEYSPDSVELLGTKTELVKEQMATLRKESQMLGTQLNALKNAGVSEMSQDFIQASNALNEVKATYQKLKAETVEYQEALKKANELVDDMATRGKSLKEALELDPTNTKLTSQYIEVLRQEITKANKEEQAFNAAIESLKANKVAETSEQFIKLRTGLSNCKLTQKELISQLNDMTTKTFEYAKSAESVKKSLSETSKTAKVLKEALELDPTSVEKQKKYTDYLQKAIEQCQEAQAKLNEQLANLDAKGIDETNSKYIELKDTLNSTIKQQQEYEAELSTYNSSTVEAVENTSSFSSGLMEIQMALSKVASSLGSVTSSLFENAQSYETNIASIKKVVTDLSDDTVSELKEIAVASGQTFESISEYATIGATLGIAQDALADFTQAMVDLSVASDNSIAGEEGAAMVARLLNQFDIGADKASNFGSAVTYVGDQFAATASEIVETASYMGGLSAINNVTINDLIGLASEMKNLGIESASGASAISKTFLTINTQVETSGSKLETFATTAGMTAKEFANAWKSDPTDAFLSFINGLSTEVFDEITQEVNEGSNALDDYASAIGVTTDAFKALWKQDPTGTFEKYKTALGDLEEGSESASVVLTDLSLSGVRVAQTLLKLAGNGDVVRDAIEDSSQAWEENTNLTKKAGEMYETTEYKLASAKEALSQAAAALGDTFLPVVKDVADIVTSLAQSFNKLPKGVKTALAATTGLATGIVKVGSAGANLLITLQRLTTVGGTVGSAATGLLAKLTGSGGLVATLGSTLPVVLGIAGAALIGYATYTKLVANDTAKFHSEIKELSETASSQYIESLKSINSEMVTVKDKFDEVSNAADNLDFNKDGKVDTSKASYKNLQQAITELNDYIGGDFYLTLDAETGQIKNQNGEVVDLQKEYQNLRAEKERSAWLDANQETYNKALETQNEQMETAVGYLTDINKWKEAIKSGGTTFSDEEIDQFFRVAEGLEDTSNWSQSAKDKYDEFIGDIWANNETLGMLFANFQSTNNLIDETGQIIDQFNQIDTAPVETVQELLNSITSEENVVVLNYDKDSVASIQTALDDVDGKIEALQELTAAGVDTSNLMAQYQEARESIASDLDVAIKKQEELESSTTTTSDTGKTKLQELYEAYGDLDTNSSKSVDNIKGELEAMSGEEGTFSTFGLAGYNAFKKIQDSYDATAKQAETPIVYTIETVHLDTYKTSGTSTKSSGRSGSKSGGFNGGYTMPNLSLPKLSTGGHGGMTLKASFTINNTGDNITQSVSQKIGKQIVSYINEELGGLI